jgi:hypothetical protein
MRTFSELMLIIWCAGMLSVSGAIDFFCWICTDITVEYVENIGHIRFQSFLKLMQRKSYALVPAISSLFWNGRIIWHGPANSLLLIKQSILRYNSIKCSYTLSHRLWDSIYSNTRQMDFCMLSTLLPLFILIQLCMSKYITWLEWCDFNN